MTPPRAGVAEQVLADRYRLVERIAVGGMGEVWRAEDLRLGRTVAVKTLKAEFVDDEDFRARFRAEARHAARLGHPGIASVYDFGESDGTAWLVMELVDGEPLSSLLRRDGALSVDRTLDLVAQTAAALQAAHDGGVVHRDVKPGNLLVRPDGVVKVTDFGIASATDAVPLTATGLVVGTAFYLSPEQAAGRSGSPASDLYALGVVAYECLAGRRPFPGDNPVVVALAHLQAEVPPLRASIPEPVCELVMRALAKDPADRFASAAELGRRAAALRAALAGSPWVEEHEQGGLAALPVVPPAGVQREPSTPPTLINAGLPAVPAPAVGGDHGVDHVEAGPRQADVRVASRRLPGSRARSSRRAVSLVAGLLALLALGLGWRAAAVDPVPPASAAPATTPAATAPRTTPPAAAGEVALDPGRYVGRPAAEVRTALARLGLVPRLAYDGSGRPVGTVSSVEPAGSLAVGSAVLVHVVPKPAATAPAPAPTQAAPAQPAPAAEEPAPAAVPPGKADKGKGRGKK
jgi:serine/threonine-protein kinase